MTLLAIRFPLAFFPAALAAALLFASGAQAADNQPPAGFTALFNGRDLTGWKGLPKGDLEKPANRAKATPDALAAAQKQADEEMRAHWIVEDGVLKFDGKGRSLCTAKDYGDFELLVDWKILPDGDSGIYLRGSPQVQIWDPASKTAAGVGSGGLFNNQKNPSKPSKVADKPIGQWNTFRIKMVGDKVSVWLNDELVVDNVVLENYWERDKPIYPTGQIELQNHGNDLYFKNIYIRELK
ncbi:MAG TPA: DUF1080 domain-containing protein [Pirellulales bacterium]|nr:DUF1080 domain-containing protein [Pirellulales bacterium]